MSLNEHSTAAVDTGKTIDMEIKVLIVQLSQIQYFYLFYYEIMVSIANTKTYHIVAYIFDPNRQKCLDGIQERVYYVCTNILPLGHDHL